MPEAATDMDFEKSITFLLSKIASEYQRPIAVFIMVMALE